MPGVLLRVGHRLGQSLVQQAPGVGRQVLIRDRRDQRMGKPQPLAVRFQDTSVECLGQRPAVLIGVTDCRSNPAHGRLRQGGGHQQ